MPRRCVQKPFSVRDGRFGWLPQDRLTFHRRQPRPLCLLPAYPVLILRTQHPSGYIQHNLTERPLFNVHATLASLKRRSAESVESDAVFFHPCMRHLRRNLLTLLLIHRGMNGLSQNASLRAHRYVLVSSASRYHYGISFNVQPLRLQAHPAFRPTTGPMCSGRCCLLMRSQGRTVHL